MLVTVFKFNLRYDPRISSLILVERATGYTGYFDRGLFPRDERATHFASSICFRSTFMSLLVPTVVSVIYLCYAHWCTRNGKHVTNQFCASTTDGAAVAPRAYEIHLCEHVRRILCSHIVQLINDYIAGN